MNSPEPMNRGFETVFHGPEARHICREAMDYNISRAILYCGAFTLWPHNIRGYNLLCPVRNRCSGFVVGQNSQYAFLVVSVVSVVIECALSSVALAVATTFSRQGG